MKRLFPIVALVIPWFAHAEETLPKPRPASIFTTDYAGMVWRDTTGVVSAPASWDKSDWYVAGGVVALGGLIFIEDSNIYHICRNNDHDSMDTITKQWQRLGNEGAYIALGGFAVAGEVFGDARAESVAQDAIPTMLLTSLVVTGGKFIVGRERPNEHVGPTDYDPFTGHSSFPSGHTANAFALATAIACNYDDPAVKVGAYTVAVGVGVSRIYQNRHYASDVYFGAVIGTFIGFTVHKLNGPSRDRTGAVADAGAYDRWQPWYDGTHTGLAWTRSF